MIFRAGQARLYTIDNKEPGVARLRPSGTICGASTKVCFARVEGLGVSTKRSRALSDAFLVIVSSVVVYGRRRKEMESGGIKEPASDWTEVRPWMSGQRDSQQ